MARVGLRGRNRSRDAGLEETRGQRYSFCGYSDRVLCASGDECHFLIGLRSAQQNSIYTTSRAFIAGAIGLALLSALGSIVAVVSIPENSGYLQLALSSIPLNDIQPEQKRLVVELIRRRTANSRENNLLIADVKKNPISPPIYSPESFADLAVIRKTTGRLQQIVAAELDYSGKQQQAMADFRTKMSKADPDYLRAWDESEKEQEAAEAKAISREKEWVASVMDLYDFAAKHIDSIKLRQGTVQFSKSALGEEFDQKQSLSKALQEKFLDLENELAQRQQQAQKKRGF